LWGVLVYGRCCDGRAAAADRTQVVETADAKQVCVSFGVLYIEHSLEMIKNDGSGYHDPVVGKQLELFQKISDCPIGIWFKGVF